jgi:YfiH family protein
MVDVRCSTRADGDFHLEGDARALAGRQRAFHEGSWTQLDEVHGTDVVVVDHPGQHDRAVADAVVTRCPGAVLAVWVGDCAPVALIGSDGAIAVAHAGWRGAIDGVLQRTVATMSSPSVRAVLGPCIHPCCYEFGAADLARFTTRFGPEVAAVTTSGTPALDMRAVVRLALAEVGVALEDRSECTRCRSHRYFSHRNGDRGRQVLTVCRMEGG